MADPYDQDPDPGDMGGGIQDDSQPPSPPISGDNTDPAITAAAGIQDDQANPAAGQGGMSAPQDQSAPPAPEPGQQGPDTLVDIEQAGQEPAGSAIAKFPGNVKKIASMLMGSGAVSPQVIEQTQKAVDPGNTQPPGNQNLLAIDAAYQKGGPQAALPLLQANRVAFNAKQAFAYTAANGTPQKPADLNAAIDAANQAEQHVLDGSNVKFSHGDKGQITATVTMAGTGKPPLTIPLTVDQFKQYLNVGGDGQWDKLMNTTIPATLQKIAGSGPATEDKEDTRDKGDKGAGEDEAADNTSPTPSTPAGRDEMGRSTNPDAWARNYEDSHDINERTKFDPKTDDEIIYRSKRMFPDQQDEKARQAWITQQQESEANRTNAVTVATEKGKLANERARITGTGRVQQADVAGQHRENAAGVYANARVAAAKYTTDARAAENRGRAAAELQKQSRIAQNSNDRNLAAMYGHRIQDVNNPMNDEETKGMEQFMSRLGSAPQQSAAPAPPSGRAAPPPTGQAAKPPGVPPGAKQFQGKWYTRGPNGEAVPVQQ